MKLINNNLQNRCGVYILTNLENGYKYIGSSKNLKKRLKKHVWDLKNSKHSNQHLQNAWNKYGEDSFEYGILCICSEIEQFNKEQQMIDFFNPEYNIQTDVINFSLNTETKLKISNTLQNKYESGFTNASKYKTNVYIYDIINWKLIKKCTHLSEAANILYNKCGTLKNSQVDKALLKGQFVVLSKEFNNIITLKNYVNKNILTYKTQDKRISFLIIEKLKKLHYFKNIKMAVDYIKCSSVSTLKKHIKNTKSNPYLIPNTNFKMYTSDKYIPIEDKAS